MAEAPETQTGRDRLALQRGFILVLALAVSLIFLWMIRGFLGALFVAAVIGIFLMPMQNGLARAFRGRRGVAAGIMLVFTVIIFGVPALILSGLVLDQAVEVGRLIAPWIQDQVRALREGGVEALPEWIPFRETIINNQTEVMSQVGSLVGNIGSYIADWVRVASGGAFTLFLNFFVFLFALYAVFARGPEMASAALSLMPMPQADRDILAKRALSTIRATVKGTFIIALIQGGLTGVALSVAGVPGAAFWGLVAGVLSIIPGIGPPLVWGPAGIILIANGQYIAGGGLIAFGTLVIGVIDNLLRPILVGKDAKMSDLMVLISTLGGLTLFGAVGIIVGPTIAALFTSVWYLYQRSYALLLDPERASATD